MFLRRGLDRANHVDPAQEIGVLPQVQEASNRVKAQLVAELMKEDSTPPCIREDQGADIARHD
jgi:hypothetical protein